MDELGKKTFYPDIDMPGMTKSAATGVRNVDA